MAMRSIMLFGVLAVIGWLGGGPVQAAQLATAKNFVPAPGTPSYFIDEGALFGGRVEASLAHSRRDAGAAAAALRSAKGSRVRQRQPPNTFPTGSAGQASAAAERHVPRQMAAELVGQIPAIAEQTEADAAAPQRIAAGWPLSEPPRIANPFGASQAGPPVPTPPGPATVRSEKSQTRSLARSTRRLAEIGTVMPPRLIASLFGAVFAIAAALAFFWRQRLLDVIALFGAANPDTSGIVDLNAMLLRLDAKIRRRLPIGTAFRLSLLPDLWPCHADETLVAATVIDLSRAAAADLRSEDSVILGTRHFRVDADLAAETPDALPGDYVRLTLRENGRGLSEAAYEQIFDSAATVRPAIVRARAVMRRLGGFVRVETAEDVGTAVHLYFSPVAAAASG
jgi:hypothetical protein